MWHHLFNHIITHENILRTQPDVQKDVVFALLQSAIGREIILSQVKSGSCALDTAVDAIVAAADCNKKQSCCTRHANLRPWFANDTTEVQQFIIRILHNNREGVAAALIRETLLKRRQFPVMILYITVSILRDDVDYFHSLTLDDSAANQCALLNPSSCSDSVKWFVTHIRAANPTTAVPVSAPIGLLSGHARFQEEFAKSCSVPPLRALVSCLASRVYSLCLALNKQVAVARDADDPQLPRLHRKQWRALRVLAFSIFVLIGNEPGSTIALSGREATLLMDMLRHASSLPTEPKTCPPKVLCAVVCTMLLLAAAVPSDTATKSGQPPMAQTTAINNPTTHAGPLSDPQTGTIAALTTWTVQLAQCVSSCEVFGCALVHVYCKEYASVRALVRHNLRWPDSLDAGPEFFVATRFAVYAVAVRTAIAPNWLSHCKLFQTLSIRDGSATGLRS